MATVQSILSRKMQQQRPTLVTVERSATVLDAVRLMAEHAIGGVPVQTVTSPLAWNCRLVRAAQERRASWAVCVMMEMR